MDLSKTGICHFVDMKNFGLNKFFLPIQAIQADLEMGKHWTYGWELTYDLADLCLYHRSGPMAFGVDWSFMTIVIVAYYIQNYKRSRWLKRLCIQVESYSEYRQTCVSGKV